MQCSDCSRVVRPVVAVDIDGTLGDYHGHFLAFAEQYLQMNLPDGHDGSGEFSEALGLPKHLYRQIKLAYRQGGMKRCMPVYDGANLLVDTVKELGAELWVTTTRPWMRLDNVDPDTRFWLEHHGIAYDALLYDENKYKLLADTVGHERVVAVVDDLPEMIDQARGAGLQAMHRWTRWNRAERRVPGDNDLHTITHWVADMIDRFNNNA